MPDLITRETAPVAGRGTAVSTPTPSATRRWRGRSGAALWPLALSLLLLLVVCCAALAPLLRGTAWWWVVATVGAIVLFGAAVLRQLGVPRAIIPAANGVVLIGTVTLFFGGGTGLLWIIPTPATVAAFVALADAGEQSIAQQTTPAEVTIGILFLLAGGTGVIALLLDLCSVTLRLGALGAAAAVVPLVIPGFIIEEGANVVLLVAAAIAFLVLLRVDDSRRRRNEVTRQSATSAYRTGYGRAHWPLGGTLLVGSLTIVGALALTAVAPAVTGGGLISARPGGLLFGTGVSPMINLGQDLRRPKAGRAFSYTSTGEQQPYFTLLTLDDIIGATWTARIDGASSGNSVDDIARAVGLGFDVDSSEVSTSVIIEGVNSHWLPAPARATSIDGLSGKWYWNDRTGAIASVTANTLNQEYTVSSLEITPTADQLRQSGTDYPSSIEANLQLPDEVPPIIAQTAQTVTASTTSNYDAAVAIQDYLRSSAFTYDTNSPVDEGYDGGGLDVVGVFLEEKRGYCVHFAATMAAMARSLGIPSRISLGYLPGVKSQDLQQGLGRYEVDSHDLHSWPELYFAGVGWVKFEPTPGRGSVPNYEQPADAATPALPTGITPATSAPSLGPDRLRDDGTITGGTLPKNAQNGDVRGIVALSALALGILLLPGATRRLVRRLRVRRIRSGGPVAVAWNELENTSLDYGISVPVTDTPRAFGRRLERLGELDSSSREALHRVLTALERERYDRLPRDDSGDRAESLAADLIKVLRAVHDGASTGRRVRALVVPASLLATLAAFLRGEHRVRPRAS